MPWSFQQSTGFIKQDGATVETGYSGTGAGRCNPAMQDVPCVGPVPRGWYSWGNLECRNTLQPGEDCRDCGGIGHHKHGPDILRLTPDPENEMHGRAGFLVHGDNFTHTASEGCIIASHPTRLKMAESTVKRLEVIE